MDLLFVYGTLRSDAPGTRAELLGPCARVRCAGKVHGALVDLGAHPGLIEPTDARSWVCGEVVELWDEDALPQLDAYEGVGQIEAAPAQYDRVVRPVECDSGEQVQAFVYRFIGASEGLPRVAGGDWVRRFGGHARIDESGR